MHNHTKNKRFLNGLLLGLLSCLLWTSAQAAAPLWTMVPAPGSNPSQTVPENGSATIQYIVQNQSGKPKRLVIQPLPGISQTTPCQLAPRGQAGSSCSLNLAISGSALPAGGIHGGPALCQANPDGSPNPGQCYQPAAAHVLNLSKAEVQPDMATISISPTPVNVEAGAISDVVTIKNESGTVTANTLSFTSDIQLVNNQCNAPLPPQGSCSFQVQSAVIGQHTVSAQGSNTNAVSLTVNVSAVPLVNISIDGPVQQNRIVGVSPADPLELTIRNDDSDNAAENIHLSNHDDCPDLMVTPTGCDSVAAGDTCTLELSSATPYEACEITVSGDNAANDPTTFIAFRDGGGLVFSVDGGLTKVVTEADISTGIAWDPDPNCFFPGGGGCTTITDGTDKDDGVQNTQNIVSSIGAGNYAAQVCNDHNGGGFSNWYLPAICEIGGTGTPPSDGCSIASIYDNLYAHGFPVFVNGTAGPATSYWSSTENELFPEFAWELLFPPSSAVGQFNNVPKNFNRRVRCVRAFNP